MSIENEKLMNLADGKLLYDDLRGRIEQEKSYPIATEEEILEIINGYHRPTPTPSQNVAIFEMEFTEYMGVPCYMTVDNVDSIGEAYLSGKRVLLHFPYSENNAMYTGSAYLMMVGYEPPYDYDDIHYPANIILLLYGLDNGFPGILYNLDIGAFVNEENKFLIAVIEDEG